MKRFVDLRGSETGNNFAWWDTIVNAFEEWSFDQAWNTVEEFRQSYEANLLEGDGELDRYLGLIPDWVPRN